ncbi:cystatin-like [Microcaecilia unicolor]|uniref:Cystatin-like n=1 Tax=Microcaecilia unicolor TaxID=1415580 RepID=A0A6P7XNB0_9AMPH|nr:cystatin-like [Microcaecilia unicolor]XP_030052126.1 cystatin-like [Microcaecilia unicolor]
MANFWLCLGVILSSSVLLSSAGLPGGPIKIDPSRSDVQDAASYAMTAFNGKSENEYLYKLLKVESAESQVVAGIKYKLKVKVGLTQCKKGSTDNAASCRLQNTSGQPRIFLCKFVVLDQSWVQEKSLLESLCEPAGQSF